MRELYGPVSPLFSLPFIWLVGNITAWNWVSMPVESIIRMIAVAALAVPKSFLKSVVFSLRCISFRSTLHLGHVNRTCLTDIRPLPHSHAAVATPGTRLSWRNWLKPIFPVRSCVSSALWGFVQPLCSRRCWCVTSGARYRK